MIGWRGGWRLLLAVLLQALTHGCGIALMGVAAWLLSRAAEHPSPSALALAAVTVRALGLGRGLARYGERLVGHDATLRVVADLRVEVFQALVDRRAAAASGELLSTVVADVEAVQDLWLRVLLPLASAALVSTACVALGLWWDTSAGLVLLAGLGSATLLLPLLSALAARGDQALTTLRSLHQVQVLDTVQGCADLTVFGAMPEALATTERTTAALAALDRRAARRAGGLSLLTALLAAGTVLGVAAVALASVGDGQLPRVDLAVVVLVAVACFEPVLPLVDAGAMLPRVAGAVRRLNSLLDGPARLEVASSGGVLRLESVGVTYPGASAPALRGIDLTLVPGRSLAVVGPSGSGKTTLVQVLAGALAPDRGSARLGTAELCDIPEVELAAQVAVAEQQAHVFDATVRDNLQIAAPDATDGELWGALRLAGLDAWTSALPQGWLTRVGERGCQLSGGEARRLSVARALLSSAPVLLLDEPTEGLDPQAADALVRRVLGASRHRAVVLVTHRKECLDAVDEVLALASGAPGLHPLPAAVSA